jgi:hypothetical protein
VLILALLLTGCGARNPVGQFFSQSSTSEAGADSDSGSGHEGENKERDGGLAPAPEPKAEVWEEEDEFEEEPAQTVDVDIPAPRLNNRPPHGRIDTTEREACQRKQDFEDIEIGLTCEGACTEASRCLRCDLFGYGIFKGGRTTKW